MIGYHFTGDTLRDGRPIPKVGKWLIHDGPIKPCASGLHASKHPFDALKYAPGPMLHKVKLVGDLIAHGEPVDKYVGRKRKILATINAEKLLREFARWCALEVIDLWDAPEIVIEFLKTGNEKIRVAARVAARAAARAAGAEWAADSADAAAADSAVAAADAAWAAAWAAGAKKQKKQFKKLVDKEFSS